MNDVKHRKAGQDFLCNFVSLVVKAFEATHHQRPRFG